MSEDRGVYHVTDREKAQTNFQITCTLNDFSTIPIVIEIYRLDLPIGHNRNNSSFPLWVHQLFKNVRVFTSSKL